MAGRNPSTPRAAAAEHHGCARIRVAGMGFASHAYLGEKRPRMAAQPETRPSLSVSPLRRGEEEEMEAATKRG